MPTSTSAPSHASFHLVPATSLSPPRSAPQYPRDVAARYPRPPKIFLSGYISASDPWQASVAAALSPLPAVVFDPLRPDWATADLHEQINWEQDALEVADIVVLNFGDASDAPITLLEFGVAVGSNGLDEGDAQGKGKRVRKQIVACVPEGYSKRVNVEIVCQRKGIRVHREMDGVIKEVQRLINDMADIK